MKTRALAVFHRPPERLNCAQAVLAAHQAVTGDHSLALASFKPWGGGRAPDGRCGALHAACLLAPASEEKLCAAFLIRIGALRCREIERPCVQCVQTACALLQGDGHTIKEVAYETGFGHLSQFSFWFTKNLKESPRKFRARHERD